MTIEIDDTDASRRLQRDVVHEMHLRRSLERELQQAFPSVPVDQVTTLVECLWTHFDGALVREYVPLLVRKQAKEELLDHVGAAAEATRPGLVGWRARRDSNPQPSDP